MPAASGRRSAAKHEAILEAASALVAERGYAAATMEGVAARAGVGKQTLYRRWPSKAPLYLEVYGRLVPAGPAPDTGGVEGDLKALLAGFFAVFRGGPAAAIAAGLTADSQADTLASDALRSGLVPFRRAQLTEALRRAAARGELDPAFNPGFAAEAVAALVRNRLLTRPDGLTDGFADGVVALVLSPWVRRR